MDSALVKIPERAHSPMADAAAVAATSPHHSPAVAPTSPIGSAAGHKSPVASAGHKSPVSAGHMSPVASAGHKSPVASAGHKSPVASAGHKIPVADVTASSPRNVASTKAVDGSRAASSTDIAENKSLSRAVSPVASTKEVSAEQAAKDKKAAKRASTAAVFAKMGLGKHHRTEAEKKRLDPDDPDFEPVYPSAWKLGIVVMALCLAILCVAVDNTILATALPRITDDFNAINEIGWIGSSYLLTSASFQLVYGVFYSFYSLKWVYMVALGLFEVGSLICGAAPNVTTLIVGRAIAGIGTAGVFNGAILIIADSVPLKKRPIYTGLVSAMYGLASVIGPLLGGVFTDHATWRWCFYINLPLGGITALFLLVTYQTHNQRLVRLTTWKERIARFDIIGIAFLLPCVICLLLALQWGGSQYSWGNWRLILLFVMFGLLLIAFLVTQYFKGDNATLPPSVVRRRAVWSSSIQNVFLGGAFFTFVYFIPVWFQAIKSVSAVQSGIRILPFMLATTILSVVAGVMVTVLGYYTPWVWAGGMLMAIGSGLITTWKVDTTVGKWIGYQVIFGLGIGMAFQQGMMAVQASVPSKDLSVATALVMFSITMGGALFLSVTQNVFTNTLIKNLAATVPELTPELVIKTGATSIKKYVTDRFGNDAANRVLVAYNGALTKSWYVGVATSCLSFLGIVFYEWKNIKTAKPDDEERARVEKKAGKNGGGGFEKQSGTGTATPPSDGEKSGAHSPVKAGTERAASPVDKKTLEV